MRYKANNMAHNTHKADRIEGIKQFGHLPSGGKFKSWARKAANKASRKAARKALKEN